MKSNHQLQTFQIVRSLRGILSPGILEWGYCPRGIRACGFLELSSYAFNTWRLSWPWRSTPRGPVLRGSEGEVTSCSDRRSSVLAEPERVFRAPPHTASCPNSLMEAEQDSSSSLSSPPPLVGLSSPSPTPRHVAGAWRGSLGVPLRTEGGRAAATWLHASQIFKVSFKIYCENGMNQLKTLP